MVYCISVCYLLVLYNHNLNVIMMLTENQIYQQYWNNYIQQLQNDFSFSLTAFCRENQIVYRHMSKWLEREGLSVRVVKEALREKVYSVGRSIPKKDVFKSDNPIKSAGFLKVVGTEPIPEQDVLCGISLTFNSGTIIAIKRGTPAAVIEFIKRYERKEDEQCSL